MYFQNPLFLIALAVLAIPVIVHLFRFRKYKTIRFTRVRFLKNVELETKNRSRLKHLITLCSRILALTSLVLAFAIPSCNRQQGSTGKTAVSIFVDNSFSMENGRDGSILFELAREKAREIIRSYGENGTFQIVSHTPSGAHLRFSSASDAIRYVDELRITPGSLKLDKVLQRMREDLNAQPEKGVAYIISDMQAGFVTGVTAQTPVPQDVRLLKLGAGRRDNISVDSAWLEQAFIVPGEKNRLFFRINNHTAEALTDFPVKLSAAGNLLGTARVQLESGGMGTGSIEFVPSAEAVQTAELSIDEPGAKFDNTLFLDLSPGAVPVVYMTGSNTYIQTVIRAQSLFNLKTTVPALTDAPGNVWVLSDVMSISAAQAEQLASWTSNGGIAVVAPDPSADLTGLSSLFGVPRQRYVTSKIQISRQGLRHPFFNRVFGKIPADMEMPSVSAYLSSEGESGNGESILSLENGDPLLLSFEHGKGKLYLYTCPLQAAQTSLVRSSLFLPVMTNTMMSGQKQAVLYGIAGSGKMYPLKSANIASDAAVMLKGSGGEWAAEISGKGGGAALFLGTQPDKAGVYSLSGRQPESIAVNYNRRESDPAAATDEDFGGLLGTGKVKWMDAAQAVLAGNAISAGSGLWRLFIWLAVAFFATEVLTIVFWDKLSSTFASNKPQTT